MDGANAARNGDHKAMLDTASIRPGSVNVIIGPNGSGKSRFLRRLCINFLRRGDDVIAIAPSVYDRFRDMPVKGLRFFGGRQGINVATKVVSSALDRAYTNNPQVLKNLTRALSYTKFDPVVGICIAKPKLENLPMALAELPADDADRLRGALQKWQSRDGQPEIHRMSLETYSFIELDSLSFAILSRYEDLLRKSKVVSWVRYYLFRKNQQISLLNACSGELCFLTTVAFIATQIKRGSVIAIDEPETSLHPTWQQKYVHELLDLFHHYEPRIIISTHSPIIISGAEATSGAVSVYEMKDGEANIFNHTQLSLEEMYDRLFGLITPKNHYLSQRALLLLNSLNSGDRNLDQVVHALEELRAKSYDESQQAVIAKFEDMARRLEVMRQGRHA